MKQIKTLCKDEFDSLFFGNDSIKDNPRVCFISMIDEDNREFKYDTEQNNFLQVRMWDITKDLYSGEDLKYRKPQKSELIKIVKHVNKHSYSNKFIVHCSAGISRSGAVATYIRDKFLDQICQEKFKKDNKYIRPNKYILNMLKELDKTRTFLFRGKDFAEKIKALDMESSKVVFEAYFPELKWTMVEEIID